MHVSYESVRYWWHRFGAQFASQIKKRRAGGMQSSNWKWHLDEGFVKINGKMATTSASMARYAMRC
jgi:putative transposase